MARLFEHEGVAPEDATRLANTAGPLSEAYHKTMVEKELGPQIGVEHGQDSRSADDGHLVYRRLFFPLIAYFFLPIPQALPVSLVLTLVALVLVGVIKGRLANLNLVISSLEVVLVGGASALGGYLLGTFLPRLLGY